MFHRTSMIAAVALSVAGPAIAGGFTPTVASPSTSPAAVTPASVAPSSNDWSGFYVGGDLSYGQVESDDFEGDGNGRLNGVHIGYQRDFGRFVLGAELEHDWGNLSVEDINNVAAADVSVDRVARAKLRLGFDAGRVMPYLTAGVARASLSGALDEDVDGQFAGVGASYQISDRFDVGVEVLRHRFDDIGGTDDSAQVTTIGLRGSIRF